ncbi:MAG TPA: hypothetical protein VHT91_46780 [Kofleriaceae bacterium]|nr:hypothetical protein [Kofleriaceae bacterium]
MDVDLRGRTTGADSSTGSGSDGLPGKRPQTNRLVSQAAPASAGATGTAAPSTLTGPAWLGGLFGFSAEHAPSGACNCAGCAGSLPRGLNDKEDVPVNEAKSDQGGGGKDDAGAAPIKAPPSGPAPADKSQPASAPGQQVAQQPGAQQPGAQQPGAQPAQPGQQAQDPAQQLGQKPAEASPTGAGATPPPAPPTITSATRKTAAGAANTRTTVGVGEVVELTGSAAGTWAASGGSPAASASGTSFVWTAPDAAGTITITLTVGKQTATKDITVVAPSSLSMVVSSQHGLTAGTAGVCMLTSVTIGPTTVCFGNTEWLEVPGPASGVSGYFTKFPAATIFHHPNPSWLQWNDHNTGLSDHAAWHSVPPPYSVGQFQWSIPNKYRVAGSSGGGTVFTTTTQQFQMTDAAGTMSVSKAGASVSRTP